MLAPRRSSGSVPNWFPPTTTAVLDQRSIRRAACSSPFLSPAVTDAGLLRAPASATLSCPAIVPKLWQTPVFWPGVGAVAADGADVALAGGRVAVPWPPHATTRNTARAPRAVPAFTCPPLAYLLVSQRDARLTRGGVDWITPVNQRSALGGWVSAGAHCLSWGKSSSQNSVTPRGPGAASPPCRLVSCARSSTRRILPEIVFGRSENSSRRTRLYGASRSRV